MGLAILSEFGYFKTQQEVNNRHGTAKDGNITENKICTSQNQKQIKT